MSNEDLDGLKRKRVRPSSMTARGLIKKLEEILKSWEGRDVEGRMDVDFKMNYPIMGVDLIEDLTRTRTWLCWLVWRP
jgi:hypothetical protein